MSYFRLGDPLDDLQRKERLEEEMPICDDCTNPINDDFCFEIETEILCQKCMNRRYRKNTEDYKRKELL